MLGRNREAIRILAIAIVLILPAVAVMDLSSSNLWTPRETFDSTFDLMYSSLGMIFNTQTVDSRGSMGPYTSLELDSNEFSHISYYDETNGDLRYVRWTGSGWLIDVVDSAGDVGLYTSLALDKNDRPHITYHKKSTGDLKAGEGNSSNYFYYVCAVNKTNVSQCSLDQVGKFTRSLDAGWNLVSVPLIPNDWRTSKVLQTTTFDRVIAYDAMDFDDHWKEYSRMKMYNDLPEMDVFKGYWVHVMSDCNLTVAGMVPTITRIHHALGWNLVGYPSLTNLTIESALEGKLWDSVEGFDNLSAPFHLKKLSGLDMMTAGHGYWIYFSTGGVWTVRN